MADEANAPLTNRDILRDLWDDARTNTQNAGKVKAALAVITSATAAYVIGGIALALRLDQTDFPVQDGLNVIPFQIILLTGIRELVLSGLVALVLIGVMLACAAPTRWPDLAWLAVPVLLLFVVPLNAGGLVWPIGLAVVGFLFRWIKRSRRRDTKWQLPVRLVLVVLLATVGAVTLARYTVPPYRFPVANLRLAPEPGETSATSTVGGYLSETSDFVYLAHADVHGTPADESSVVGYARDRVLTLALSPPGPPLDAPRSLLDYLGGPSVSVTPLLDVWSGGEYHGLRLFR
jgi:hypothetical protein